MIVTSPPRCSTVELGESDSGRTTRDARLQAIKADIAAHIQLEGLTVGVVAARQHISARYVQMLFKSEGTTFSHFVLRQRLALAKRMLTDRRYDSWTICAIAMEAGFGDLSYFDHAFRRLYAASPSEARALVRRRFVARNALGLQSL
jgi:AraC-like DNA-binding protein